MSQINNLIAQADSEVLNTLAESDQKLGELNTRLDVIKQEYNILVDVANSYSFFNLDNIYFWFVIIGLVLLVFGLMLLLAELQSPYEKMRSFVLSKKKPKEDERRTLGTLDKDLEEDDEEEDEKIDTNDEYIDTIPDKPEQTFGQSEEPEEEDEPEEEEEKPKEKKKVRKIKVIKVK